MRKKEKEKRKNKTWKQKGSGYDLASDTEELNWLSDKQRSVLSKSNTPQSTLGSGFQPVQ